MSLAGLSGTPYAVRQSLATTPATTPPTEARPPMRWVSWTCEKCKAANKTRTRKDDRRTCPRCGHVQLGDEAKKAHEAKLARIQQRQRRQATSATQRASSSRPVRVRGETQPTSQPPAPPVPPVEPPRSKSVIDRLLGYT